MGREGKARPTLSASPKGALAEAGAAASMRGAAAQSRAAGELIQRPNPGWIREEAADREVIAKVQGGIIGA